MMSMALMRSTSPPSPPDGGRSAGAGADLAESSAVGVGGGRPLRRRRGTALGQNDPARPAGRAAR